jgi:hypothetical protein
MTRHLNGRGYATTLSIADVARSLTPMCNEKLLITSPASEAKDDRRLALHEAMNVKRKLCHEIALLL